MLGSEIICSAEMFKFVERDQIIYDRQEQISVDGMMGYGYMILHFLQDLNFLKEEFQGKESFLQIHLTQS